MKRVLAVLSINPDFVEFAIPELKSILSQIPIPLEILLKDELTIQPKHSYEITHQTLKNFPYVTLTVPEFDKYSAFFEKACKQTIMLHKFVLLISKGKNYEDLIQNRDEQMLKQRCRNWQDTVICDFISRNRVLGRKHQIQKINKLLGDMDIRGKIDLESAKKRYQLIQQHNWYQQHHESPVESTLKSVYFGIELCSNKIGKAKFNYPYELSKRIYLGPTSADNDLAFMMCNQGRVKEGSFVIDPFVGTGGLIIPPASKGAYVFGCDLDMRVLNGYSVGRINKRSPYYSAEKKFEVFTPKIVLNFEQYGFAIPNIFRMDSTNLAFKNEPIFDAIITDPPYGLRAMSRSIGNNKGGNVKEQVQEQVQGQVEQNQSKEEATRQIEQKTQQTSQQQQQEIKSQEPKGQQQPTSTNLTQEQKQKQIKKQQRRKAKKQNKQIKRQQMTQEEKQFKKHITEKLNRERIDQWDKFDKGKVECTEREKIFQRLIEFGRKNLKVGGRLVFLYPIYEDEEWKRIQSLPKCQGFEVIDMSENVLSKKNSRILVTLEKLATLQKTE